MYRLVLALAFRQALPKRGVKPALDTPSRWSIRDQLRALEKTGFIRVDRKQVSCTRHGGVSEPDNYYGARFLCYYSGSFSSKPEKQISFSDPRQRRRPEMPARLVGLEGCS